jgi:hypothetical protein
MNAPGCLDERLFLAVSEKDREKIVTVFRSTFRRGEGGNVCALVTINL